MPGDKTAYSEFNRRVTAGKGSCKNMSRGQTYSNLLHSRFLSRHATFVGRRLRDDTKNGCEADWTYSS